MRIPLLKYPITLALGILCLLLAAIVAWVVTTPILRDTKIASNAIKPAPGLKLAEQAHDVTFDGIDKYQEIIERPLFFQGRRPLPLEEQKTKAEEKPVENNLTKYSLSAVIITPDKRLALVNGPEEIKPGGANPTTANTRIPPGNKNPAGKNKFFRIEEGTEWQGWRLQNLTREAAVFQNGKQQHELRMVRKTPDNFAQAAKRNAALANAQAAAQQQAAQQQAAQGKPLLPPQIPAVPPPPPMPGNVPVPPQ